MTWLVALALIMVLVVSCAAPVSAPSATPTPKALFTPTSAPTLTVSKVQEIKARGKLIVAVRQEQGPRGIHVDPAHVQTRDLEVALARAIAKKLLGEENKAELRSGPALAIIGTVQGGDVDLGLATIFHAPTTDSLKQQVEVSEPFATGGVALIASTSIGISTVRGLDGKKVARIQTGRDIARSLKPLPKNGASTLLLKSSLPTMKRPQRSSGDRFKPCLGTPSHIRRMSLRVRGGSRSWVNLSQVSNSPLSRRRVIASL